MTWNWQQPDWPRFRWRPERLRRAEERFLVGGGVILGSVGHLDESRRQGLTVEVMTQEAGATSEIEGEVLDRDSVQSSIRRQLGLAAEAGRASPAERGIAELMVTLYREWDRPLDHQTLFAWHEMVMRGRRDLRQVGAYRTHPEPMQVVSGRLWEPKVHFEAPPSARVPQEMDAFCAWFNRTAPGGPEPLPALARAGIAHLHFESIHPFEDGNGRLGRVISEKALAQGPGGPALTALAVTILARQRSYYDMLERSNKHNDIDAWLAWFAGIALEAQQRTQAQIEFLIEKARLLERLRGQLNARQEKALLRMLAEGPGGFKGGLSAANYISITKASPATATRDLADLVDKEALTRTGERRHTRYHLTIPLRPPVAVTINENGEITTAQSERVGGP